MLIEDLVHENKDKVEVHGFLKKTNPKSYTIQPYSKDDKFNNMIVPFSLMSPAVPNPTLQERDNKYTILGKNEKNENIIAFNIPKWLLEKNNIEVSNLEYWNTKDDVDHPSYDQLKHIDDLSKRIVNKLENFDEPKVVSDEEYGKRLEQVQKRFDYRIPESHKNWLKYETKQDYNIFTSMREIYKLRDKISSLVNHDPEKLNLKYLKHLIEEMKRIGLYIKEQNDLRN